MRIKWKRGSYLLSLIVLMTALAACGGNSGGSPGASSSPSSPTSASQKPTDNNTDKPVNNDPVKLTFWTLGTNGYEELTKEYTEKVKTNVTIEVQNTSDQTVHHNNMLTALQAGTGAPDIFMLEIAFLDRFIEASDKFVNLYDMGAESIKGNYLDWKWQQAEADGGKYLLGLPTDVGPTVAYYRTDLLQQAGLPTEPDAFMKEIDTWEKFFTVAKQFKEKTGKEFIDMPDLLFNSIRDQGDVLYYDENDKFIGDTNPLVKKAWDYTVRAIQEGWVGLNRLWTAEWGQATNNGDFAVLLGPAWMSGVIKGNAPDANDKWAITQMPEGAGNWGGSFISLPKEGKHADEAYAFISWLLAKEQQIKSFQSNGLMPSIPSLYDDPIFTSYTDEFYNDQEIAKEFGIAAKTVRPIRYGKLHDATDALFKEGLQNILVKKADPAKEWDDVMKKINELNKRS